MRERVGERRNVWAKALEVWNRGRVNGGETGDGILATAEMKSRGLDAEEEGW